MKTLRTTLCALILVLLTALPGMAKDALYQYSTIDALMAGLYDGELGMGDLLEKGDFGLGTLNGLDGELIVLDGKGYHARAGGMATVSPASAKVPFAAVVRFSQDMTVDLAHIPSLEALDIRLDRALPGNNVFYAIRIDGTFSAVTTRAIPRQTPPYKPLAVVARTQVLTRFADVRGTLVGIKSPAYVKGIGVPGYHWHFITEDGKRGGHVLAVAFTDLQARVDMKREFTLALPGTRAFETVDLTPDRSGALKKVESLKKQ